MMLSSKDAKREQNTTEVSRALMLNNVGPTATNRTSSANTRMLATRDGRSSAGEWSAPYSSADALAILTLCTRRWREPALSIHDVRSAGPSHKSLIPSWATAKISIRIVPDQSLDSIIAQLKRQLEQSFAGLRTVNQLEVSWDGAIGTLDRLMRASRPD